jgi:hypothetical protein
VAGLIMPMSLRFTRALLCVQGILPFALVLYLLATLGPDQSHNPYVVPAIATGAIFAVCVAAALSLRTGQKSAAIAAIMLELLWAAGAAEGLVTSGALGQSVYLWTAIYTLTLITALASVAGLFRSPARRYFAARP